MSLVAMSSAAVILPLSLCSGTHIVVSLRSTLPATQRCSAFQRPQRLLWRGCVLQALQLSDMRGYQQVAYLCKIARCSGSSSISGLCRNTAFIATYLLGSALLCPRTTWAQQSLG